MKHILFIFFIGIFTACNSTKKESSVTAIAFSEKIVDTELELGGPLARAEQSIISKLDSNDFAGVGAIAEEAESLINNKIKEIEAMRVKGFASGDAFKASAINYFEYVKSIYTNYKNIGTASNEGQRLYEVRRMDSLRVRQNEVVTQMQAAQKQFAASNGFSVDTQ